MKMFLKSTLLLAFVLSFGLTSGKASGSNAEQEKVKQVFNNFIKAIEAGNADGYFSHITEDFIAYDPGREPISNGPAFKKEIEDFLEANNFKLSNYTSEEVIVREDIAVHRHRGTININPKGTDTNIQLKVKYLDVLKKNTKGEWKIYMHTVNTID